jgi:hypothetical protein
MFFFSWLAKKLDNSNKPSEIAKTLKRLEKRQKLQQAKNPPPEPK